MEPSDAEEGLKNLLDTLGTMTKGFESLCARFNEMERVVKEMEAKHSFHFERPINNWKGDNIPTLQLGNFSSLCLQFGLAAVTLMNFGAEFRLPMDLRMDIRARPYVEALDKLMPLLQQVMSGKSPTSAVG